MTHGTHVAQKLAEGLGVYGQRVGALSTSRLRSLSTSRLRSLSTSRLRSPGHVFGLLYDIYDIWGLRIFLSLSFSLSLHLCIYCFLLHPLTLPTFRLRSP